MTKTDQILQVENLSVEFRRHAFSKPFRAVDDVSFQLMPGRTLGIVGESGSGKTTIGRAILGLTPVSEGTVRFLGKDITNASRRERRDLAAEMQAIYQDPYSSLNPVRTIGQTLSEGLLRHRLPKDELRDKVVSALQQVRLASDTADRYPTQFSGGQRQRIAIARALIVVPKLIVCDEPTSALDLSVQAQVLNLLRELQETLQLSYLFISHNLSVVRYLSHEIMVIYRGRIVERGPATQVYESPGHPYTKALLDAEPVPDADTRNKKRSKPVRSEPETTAPDRGKGCDFRSRCPFAIDICRDERPGLDQTATGSFVRCHRAAEMQEIAGS